MIMQSIFIHTLGRQAATLKLPSNGSSIARAERAQLIRVPKSESLKSTESIVGLLLNQPLGFRKVNKPTRSFKSVHIDVLGHLRCRIVIGIFRLVCCDGAGTGCCRCDGCGEDRAHGRCCRGEHHCQARGSRCRDCAVAGRVRSVHPAESLNLILSVATHGVK